MKNRKSFRCRLISAIAACFFLVGSVGAWFALGKSAEMTGITVKMDSTETGGIILNTSGLGGNPSESLNISASTTNMNPCTTADALTFYKVNESTSAVSGSNGSISGLSASCFETATGDTYYAEYWIYVKSTDSTAYTSFSVSDISVSGTGANDAINKALRVAVIFANDTYIYAPVSGATDNYKSLDGNGTMQTVTLAQYGTNYSGANIGTSYSQISVYIWYEGQDEACTTQNMEAITGSVDISITFSAE